MKLKYTFDSLIEKLTSLGYRLDFIDGKRYASLYKHFNISDNFSFLDNSDKTQIGRGIEIYDSSLVIKEYCKYGSDWSSQARLFGSKGHSIYMYGKSRIIENVYK